MNDENEKKTTNHRMKAKQTRMLNIKANCATNYICIIWEEEEKEKIMFID